MNNAGSGWHVPADTTELDRVWMTFPRAKSINAATSWQLSSARRSWAKIAHTIHDHEPVVMIVDPVDTDVAPMYLDASIQTVSIPIDNAVLGRTGPTFTLSPANSSHARRHIGMVDWRFNGFGRRPGVEYRLDDVANGTLANVINPYRSQHHRKVSMMVAEGGAWITDGAGTAIASEAVLLDPRRNPGWNKGLIEREIRRLTDITRVIWIPGGLSRHSGPQGQGGHADQVVTFTQPGVVLLHWQADSRHPDHEVSQTTEKILHAARDASGNRLSVIRVPAPQTHSDGFGPVAWTYVDLLPINKSVVAPSFIDPHDRDAHQIIAENFPQRRLITVLAQEVYDRGASLKAITLLQPHVGRARRARYSTTMPRVTAAAPPAQ